MYIIVTASPNTDGLTAACGQAALSGIEAEGKTAEIIDLCKEKINSCLSCGNGWGTCRTEHRCIIEDILPEMQKKLGEAEGIFLITPVYWAGVSEHMRYFLNRFRRCEAFKGENSCVADKRISLVAAAGGSGNGTVSCLADMETWCRHVSANPLDRIGITRFNREKMLEVIRESGRLMALGTPNMRGHMGRR